MKTLLSLAILLSACGGHVESSTTPPLSCTAEAPEGSISVRYLGCTDVPECTDAAAARASLSSVRTCFPSSVADVYAILPSIRLGTNGCVTSFVWTGTSELLRARHCVERLLEESRYTCLVDATCASGTTVTLAP